MVCLGRIRAYYHENAHNDAEQICYCPPCEIWEGAFDSGDNGGDEGDKPSELWEITVNVVSTDAIKWKRKRKRTYAIDRVASANGSPTICPRTVQYVLCFPSDTAYYQS